MDPENDDGVRIDVEEPIVNLNNENPMFLVNIFNFVSAFFQIYGWVFLVAGGLGYLFWVNFMRPRLRQLEREARAAEEKKTDANEFIEREAAVLAARERLQAKYNSKVEEFKTIQAQKEEEKRQNLIEDWDRHQEGKGYRSKTRLEDDDSNSKANKSKFIKPKQTKSLRPVDYNPLMGGGGSSGGYRPSPRGGFGGGGGG